MAEPALRAIAAVGVLATGLLFGGLTPPAGAQPDGSSGSSDSGGSSGSSGSSQDAGGSGGSGGEDSPKSTEPGGSGGADDGGSRISDPDPAQNTGTGTAVPGDVGDSSGGTDTSGGSVASGGGSRTESPPPPQEAKKAEHSTSLSIPMVRLPAAGEVPLGGWPSVSTFYTTVEIHVPTFEEFLAALGVVTTPAPAPGPSFRTQEEAPVVDATTGTTHGGGGGGSGAPVLRAPLVTVPRAVTVAGVGAKPTVGEVAGAWAQPGVIEPGAAGARTPVIRGSLPPTPGVASVPTATPMSGQPARIGYPRYMRSPTVTELAVVALPGLAGLFLLTFGGGLIGYRQANSVRFVRTAGAERFLP